MDEDALRAVLERCLADYWTCRRGQILYSGIDTLVPGQFYFLGFNPAADGTNPLLCEVPLGRTQWSAYVHQCWYCGLPDRRQAEAGCHPLKPHQTRVIEIMEQLDLVPENTFATNLFFTESPRASNVNIRELWDPCWNVHREMLAEVKPTYIVCLGNSRDRSVFNLLWRRAGGA